jgi:hypothetical protein
VKKKMLKTSSDMRKFLMDAAVAVREGTLDPYRAKVISKLATEINENLRLEIMAGITGAMESAGWGTLVVTKDD